MDNLSSHCERLRSGCRRPIEAHEVPHLERLGRLLRELRRAAGLSQGRLAKESELSLWMIGVLEMGARRTRWSTLRRVASALVEAKPVLGDDKELTERLAAAAGPALAPESQYADRVERRRARRKRKGRYGRREKTAVPLPGESLRHYLRRLASSGASAPPGVI